MTVLEYYETTARPYVFIDIVRQGRVYGRPGFLFDEKGVPIGILLNGQVFPEQYVNIELKEDNK